MRIVIISPFNPMSVADYLSADSRRLLFDNHVDSSSINSLVRGLLAEGHHITMVSSHAASGDDVRLNGEQIDVRLVSERKPLRWRLVPSFYFTVLRLRRALRQVLGNADVLHAHWTYIHAMAAVPFAKSLPSLCTVRDWHPLLTSMNAYEGRMDSIYHGIAFRRVMACRYLHFVANSQYTSRYLASRLHATDIPIVPNSVREDFVMTGTRTYPDSIRLLSIQQYIDDPRKNMHRLLDAFAIVAAEHPDARLRIVGNFSTDDASVFRHASELGLADKVEFLGKRSHLDLIPLFDSASALIHPSLEETFGNIFLEAFGRRLPAIGGRESGAVPQVLGDGRYGILCDVTSADDMARAILSLHDSSIDRQSLVAAAYDNLIAHYTAEAVARQYVKLYEKILSVYGSK
mgnify:FL=1